MIYDFVPFEDVGEEIARNLEAHYNDADSRDDYGRPDLDWPAYITLSREGKCGAVIARNDGELIAYSVFIIGMNINHKQIAEALNTGFFIAEKWRGKITNEFLRKSDEYLKEIGVDRINYVLSDDRLGQLLKRKGYKSKFITWSK
jgi:hypothetical protein